MEVGLVFRRTSTKTLTSEIVRKKYLLSSDKLEDYENEEVKTWCRLNFRENPVNENEDIYSALENLAKYLFKHWEKEIFVLTDEYDSICSDAIIKIKDEEEIKSIIALCSGTLSFLLRSTDENIKVAQGILKGISYIMTTGLSKINLRNYV